MNAKEKEWVLEYWGKNASTRFLRSTQPKGWVRSISWADESELPPMTLGHAMRMGVERQQEMPQLTYRLRNLRTKDTLLTAIL